MRIDNAKEGTAPAKVSRVRGIIALLPSLILVWLVLVVEPHIAPWQGESTVINWVIVANLMGIVISEIWMALSLKLTMVDLLVQRRLNPSLLVAALLLALWLLGQVERLESISSALVGFALWGPAIVYGLVLDMAYRMPGALNRPVFLGLLIVVLGGIFGLLVMLRWPLSDDELVDRLRNGQGSYEVLVQEYRASGVDDRWEARSWDWWWMPLQTTMYGLGSGGPDEVLMQMLGVQSIWSSTSLVEPGSGSRAILFEVRRFRGIETTPTTYLVYSEEAISAEIVGDLGLAGDGLPGSHTIAMSEACREIEAPWYICRR